MFLSSTTQMFGRTIRFVKMKRQHISSTPINAAAAAALGDKVKLHYVFRSSTDETIPSIDSKVVSGGRPDVTTTGKPLEMLLGSGQTMRALEDATKGMTVGETKQISLKAIEAFGEVSPDIRVPLSQLPPDVADKLEPGLPILTQQGNVLIVREIDQETKDVVFDPNHPMAGHDVDVDLEVVELEAADTLPFAERLVLPSTDMPESKEGDGENFPRRGDTCQMHYTGRLIDGGAQFDSSRDRGEPFEFVLGVGNVIAGWDEGVMHMSKGQRALLRIPSAKAYGERGAGAAIPPNADLEFDVELLDIKRPKL